MKELTEKDRWAFKSAINHMLLFPEHFDQQIVVTDHNGKYCFGGLLCKYLGISLDFDRSPLTDLKSHLEMDVANLIARNLTKEQIYTKVQQILGETTETPLPLMI